MNEKKIPLIFGILGAILIGAIGSGLWNIVLEPALSWLGKSLFTIATLGLNSARDAIYADIARGYHESPSLILLCLVLLVPFFTTSYLGGHHVGRKLAEKEYVADLNKLKKIMPDVESEEFFNKISAITAERYRTALKRARITMLLHAVLLTSLGFFMIINVVYTNKAITNFKQSLEICKPFIDLHGEELFISKFAQIKSKEDYIDIIDELKKIATNNDVKLPPFTAL